MSSIFVRGSSTSIDSPEKISNAKRWEWKLREIYNFDLRKNFKALDFFYFHGDGRGWPWKCFYYKEMGMKIKENLQFWFEQILKPSLSPIAMGRCFIYGHRAPFLKMFPPQKGGCENKGKFTIFYLKKHFKAFDAFYLHGQEF